MAKEIRWTFEAEETFAQVIEFLGVNWTEKEIGNFVSATERVIHFINET